MTYDLKIAEMIERIYSSDEINYGENFKDIELAFIADDYLLTVPPEIKLLLLGFFFRDKNRI